MHAEPQRFPHTVRDWKRALEDEDLIDVGEWCDTRGLTSPLPATTAMTAAVCDAIERIPFRLLQQVTATERGAAVFARAGSLLGGTRDGCRMPGPLALAFNAALLCRADDRCWRRLLLRSDRLESAARIYIIGLATAQSGWSTQRPCEPIRNAARTVAQHPKRERSIVVSSAIVPALTIPEPGLV